MDAIKFGGRHMLNLITYLNVIKFNIVSGFISTFTFHPTDACNRKWKFNLTEITYSFLNISTSKPF